jgi:hypothetical protein
LKEHLSQIKDKFMAYIKRLVEDGLIASTTINLELREAVWWSR